MLLDEDISLIPTCREDYNTENKTSKTVAGTQKVRRWRSVWMWLKKASCSQATGHNVKGGQASVSVLWSQGYHKNE